jgi:hypothetical protein
MFTIQSPLMKRFNKLVVPRIKLGYEAAHRSESHRRSKTAELGSSVRCRVLSKTSPQFRLGRIKGFEKLAALHKPILQICAPRPEPLTPTRRAGSKSACHMVCEAHVTPHSLKGVRTACRLPHKDGVRMCTRLCNLLTSSSYTVDRINPMLPTSQCVDSNRSS